MKKVIFVYAHPDDETLASGGTIIKLARKGYAVKLITATRGEAGKSGDPNVKHPPEKMAVLRTAELKAAAEILGISEIFFLDYLDGTLKHISKKKLAAKILKILNLEKPDVVVTHDKHGGSNHPDHIAVSQAATRAFEIYKDKIKKHVRLYHLVVPRSHIRKRDLLGFAYTAFGKIKGTADKQITTFVDIRDAFDKKTEALHCHATQHEDCKRHIKCTKILDRYLECYRLISENKII
jgi:LmbE family N-acetylglucosaminyl deacetylase